MKRTALFAAAITVALAAPMALPPTATATAVDTISGTVVEVVHETPDSTRGADRHELVLATGSGFVPLSADGIALTPGEHVTVEVTRRGDAVRVVDVVSSYVESDAAGADADIDREVYVGIVAPAGYTVADNTATIASVQQNLARAADYWSSQTGGTIRFSYGGTVSKYVSAHSCGDTVQMWDEAVAKFADAGIDVTGVGKYLLLVGPTGSSETDECDYGLGTLGGLDAAWNATFVSDGSQSLYAHELGHNLGLAHANALRCNGVQDGIWDGTSFGTSCARWRYEDLLDVMGYSGETYGEGNLNAAHLDDLDLDPTAIRPVSGPATVTIPPLSDTDAAGRGVKVTDSSGATYYVEYRTATGRDAIATVNPYRPSMGVLLYREDPGAYRGHGSYHLDATPFRSDDFDYDRALRPGSTFTSAAGTLSITTVSQSASGAVVEISGGATVTEPEPVAITLTGPSKVRHNGTVTLRATVLSDTNVAVPDSEVTFQRKVGGTWESVVTARTGANGVARATVRLRESTTFRVATTAPVTYSSSTAVKVRRAKKRS